MSKGRTLSQLISAGAVLADGQISASEIVGMVSVLKVTGTTYPGNDLAANPSGGQTITLAGSNFISTPTVYVGDTIAPSVTFVSSTQLTFTAPAKAAGTYSVYVVNPDGTTAILVNGISYSGTPAWTTAAGSLGSVDANFTIQLQAAGDAPITYALTSGSTLPSGVTLSSSGLITGTAIGSDQTFSFSVDAIDAQNQETPRSFQVTVVLADPFFRYTTLLLQADPLITPFNNDASTNAFSLSLNGDIRSDSFTPYQGLGYYSVAFDGNGDYLTTPTTTDFDLTGDFTIECWVNVAALGQNCLFSVGVPRGAYSYTVYINPDNTVTWALNNVATWNVSHSYSTTDTVPLNTWTHLAFVRSGSNFTIYINGVSKATTASYTQPSTASGTVYIGTYFENTNNDGSFFRGCVSNFRVVKGTALYTAAFTPPTSPLTAVTNTKFLIAQNNRFVDNSTNNYAITRVGDTKISPAQPFTNPTNISTYGSGYFNGSNTFLNTVSDAAFGFGTGDFTVEFFIYPTATVNTWTIYHGTVTNSFIINTNASGNLVIRSYGVADLFTSAAALSVNAWNHVAVARSGTTISLWLNGSRANGLTGTNFTNFANTATYIGRADSAVGWVQGYIADVRTVKGTAVYSPASTTITVPTAPLTAVSGTSLLTLQYNNGSNNSGFEDGSQFNWPVTRVGNLTQGTFTPYGTGWSNYFDGNGDYLQVSSTPFDFSGGADFTLEFFMYIPDGVAYGFIYQNYTTSSGITGQAINAGSNFVGFENWNGGDQSPTVGLSGTTLPGQWNHVALVRNGSGTNNLSLYINGSRAQQGTLTSFTAPSQSSTNIGARNYLGYKNYLTGYISNFRIVKGTGAALYSGATYTVPTTALTAIPNTVLLICNSNRFIDSSTNNYSITRTGDVGVQRFDPFPPTATYSTSVIGGSAYFDGSGDYIDVAANNTFSYGTSDFEISFWYYPMSANGYLIDQRTTDTQAALTLIYNTGSLQLFANGTTVISGTEPRKNSWHYVTLSRVSGTTRLFADGAQVGSNYTDSNNYGALPIRIGCRYAVITDIPLNGYISDFRVVKGVGVTSQTVPAVPLTRTANTSLLLNFTNAGIYDGTGISNIETIGGTQVTSNIKKYGSGSIAMLTTSDYCRATLPSTFGDINGGDFTIEFWVNFTSVSANRGLISKYGNTAENAGALGYVVQFQQSIPAIRFVLGNGSTDLVYDFPWSPATSTWYHVAITRSGTSARAFVNGTQIGSTTTVTTADVASPNPVQIGKTHTAAQYLLGYMDDIRVTRGVARYTANFTAPTSAMKAR